MMLLVRSNAKKATVLALAILLSVTGLRAQQWVPLGPFGGNARSLAYDPHDPGRVFLGTSAGQLYRSQDGGVSWARLADFGDDGYVLDNIVVDPRVPDTIYVAAWRLDGGGDLFRSHDGGATWTALGGVHGKSIRALVLAPSQPRVIVAGALDGIFRSADGGDTWERISPEGHPELKNIESLAIDPYHPEVIYAGTWHLPWKTSNGGRTWHTIRNGVIDDSDVFSIFVDRMHPTVIYASACTGIYRSNSAGELFRRVQGIPRSAQRTRALEQDPVNSGVVYAGTTEGLWKTQDGGATWQRRTAADVVVNDIIVDPRRPARVLLATDGGGVLASDDGGRTFLPSNHGFAHRQVTAVLVDRNDANTIYVSAINDRELGGVFVSRDAGAHWTTLNHGLGARDVFTLQQTTDGSLIAGTNTGIFTFSDAQWRPLGGVGPRSRRGRRPAASSLSSARVVQLAVLPGRWLALTSAGLFTSRDEGRTWRGGPLAGEANLTALGVSGKTLLASAPRALFIAHDGGTSWALATLPAYINYVYTVAITPGARLWITTDQGAFTSADGRAWEHIIAGVPARNLRSVTWDAEAGRLLGASMTSGEIFESRDDGRSWARVADSGWPIRAFVISRGRLLAATPFSGLIAPPEHAADAASPAASTAGKQ